MRIAIIDADLIGNKKHRFPNLVCMKLSNYHKLKGDNVVLLLEYKNLECYDKVYISKVFTATFVPENVLDLSNVEYGGTGFFYDKAKPLPFEIEHCMPDYHLYDDWVENQIKNGGKRKDFTYYLDYSIGFKKRGSTFNARCKNTVFEYPCGRSKLHPTEKNHDLLQELILDNSNEGDIVFDPCAGSGSHLLVARDNNRKFIGCELCGAYYDVANQRLSTI